MRAKAIPMTIVLLAACCAATAMAQGQPQVITIPLSMPGEKMSLEISLQSAHIEVIGEDRADAEFSVTVEQEDRKIITPSGAQPIAGGAYSLEVDEEDNHISVDTGWRSTHTTIVARIPRRADLELSTVNDGSIVVRNVEGNLELGNVNGPITASGIAGSVIAESVNDTIDVSFVSIDGSVPMALTSLNGDLKLGLPPRAGAQLHLDTGEGEIYSDFEVEVLPTAPVVERRNDRGGVEVRVESVIVANVNGGGPVIRLKTLNGDINIARAGN